MATLNRDARQEVVLAVIARYGIATKTEKAKILDEFVAITGYHRKHAIRVLNAKVKPSTRRPRANQRRIYDEAVREALIVRIRSTNHVVPEPASGCYRAELCTARLR